MIRCKVLSSIHSYLFSRRYGPNEASFHDVMDGKAQSEDLLTPRTSRLLIVHPTSRLYIMPPSTPSTKAGSPPDGGNSGSSRQIPSLEAMADLYRSTIEECEEKLRIAKSNLATAKAASDSRKLWPYGREERAAQLSSAEEQVKELTADLDAAKHYFENLNKRAIKRRYEGMHQMTTTGSGVSLTSMLNV